MQAQHQAHSPPICLQVVLMVYADGLGRGDGLLFVSFVSFVSSGPVLFLSFSVSSIIELQGGDSPLLKQVAIIIYIL